MLRSATINKKSHTYKHAATTSQDSKPQKIIVKLSTCSRLNEKTRVRSETKNSTTDTQKTSNQKPELLTKSTQPTIDRYGWLEHPPSAGVAHIASIS